MNKAGSGNGLIEVKLKVKVALQHIKTITEREQRYSSTRSLTSARQLYSVKGRRYTAEEDGWAPRLVWTGMVKKNLFPLKEVRSHHTDYAKPEDGLIYVLSLNFPEERNRNYGRSQTWRPMLCFRFNQGVVWMTVQNGTATLTCSVSVLSSCTTVTNQSSQWFRTGPEVDSDGRSNHYMNLSSNKLSELKSCKIVTSCFSYRIRSRTRTLSRYRECNSNTLHTVMRRITTFRSTTDRIYDGGKNFSKTLDKLTVEESYY